ncbi:hypothetical protein AZ78_0456 [Lysobacter capsici AZ78]|uniref:Uncharacterized protein n=1 Tax=Lysobacter capsici AZ78 TaxID=1444315 RepID=A0A108U5G4_9GAMM|nr:hypothetical protein AZ78_0456 [Lysobacter capsici AZ78]
MVHDPLLVGWIVLLASGRDRASRTPGLVRPDRIRTGSRGGESCDRSADACKGSVSRRSAVAVSSNCFVGRARFAASRRRRRERVTAVMCARSLRVAILPVG